MYVSKFSNELNKNKIKWTFKSYGRIMQIDAIKSGSSFSLDDTPKKVIYYGSDLKPCVWMIYLCHYRWTSCLIDYVMPLPRYRNIRILIWSQPSIPVNQWIKLGIIYSYNITSKRNTCTHTQPHIYANSVTVFVIRSDIVVASIVQHRCV